jgi:DNA-3-methyladenine glycosylase I
LVAYHDDEWGRPVTSDDRLYEKMCLEGFQAGLSWLTILRKRDAFRSAFADFAVDAVAAFDERDVERMLGDAGIIRNRGKIEAVIANAAVVQKIQAAEGSFSAFVWGFAPAAWPAPTHLADIPAITPESTALAKELRRRGARFVGPTTMYALMEAMGMVNDHLVGCHVRDAVENERAASGARH